MSISVATNGMCVISVLHSGGPEQYYQEREEKDALPGRMGKIEIEMGKIYA